MATELTKEQFIEILLDKEITKPRDLAVFQAIYSFEGHKAYASQVGRILGIKARLPASPINLQIGRLAKRIAQKYDVKFTVRKNQKLRFWDLFFKGWEEGRFFV
jgi:5-methylcytosine-specific restriction protein A